MSLEKWSFVSSTGSARTESEEKATFTYSNGLFLTLTKTIVRKVRKVVTPMHLTRWPRLLVAATQGVPFVHASPTKPEVGSGKWILDGSQR